MNGVGCKDPFTRVGLLMDERSGCFFGTSLKNSTMLLWCSFLLQHQKAFRKPVFYPRWFPFFYATLLAVRLVRAVLSWFWPGQIFLPLPYPWWVWEWCVILLFWVQLRHYIEVQTAGSHEALWMKTFQMSVSRLWVSFSSLSLLTTREAARK